jgi:hypothetical protein
VTRSRMLGVVGLLALLLAAGARPAIQQSARAAAPLTPSLGIAGAEGTPLERVVTLNLRVTCRARRWWPPDHDQGPVPGTRRRRPPNL